MSDSLYPMPSEGFTLLTAEAAPEQISDLVGVPFEIFTNTILSCQNSRGRNVQDFLDADFPTQQRIFKTLFNLGLYEEAEITATAERKQLDALWSKVETEWSQASLLLTTNTAQMEELKKSIEGESVNRKSQAEALQKDLEECRTRLEDPAASRLLEEVKGERARLHKLLVLQDSVQKTLSAKQTELQGWKIKSAEVTSNIQNKEGRLASLKLPVEPHTGTELSALGEVITALQAQEKELQVAIGEATAEIRRWGVEVKRWDELNVQFDRAVTIAQTDLDLAIKSREEALKEKARLSAELEHLTDCTTCGQQFATPEAKAKATQSLASRIAAIRIPELGDREARLAAAKEQVAQHEATKPSPIPETQSRLDTLRSELTDVATNLLSGVQMRQEILQYRKDVERITLEKQELEYALVELRPELEFIQSQMGPVLTTEIDQLVENAKRMEEEVGTCREYLQQIEIKLAQGWGTLPERIKLLEGQIAELGKPNPVQESMLTNLTQEGIRLKQLEEVKRVQFDEVKARIEILDRLVQSLGDEGIPAELFRGYLPSLQRLANDYLGKLTNHELQVEFLPEKELKKKVEGAHATRQRFQIKVRKVNGGADYELISGSEQAKAALVVNCALADLAYQQSGTHCNIRVYDEIFDTLDHKGMERLANLLLESRATPLTFVITHKTELEDSFQSRIVLRKEKGHTRVDRICE